MQIVEKINMKFTKTKIYAETDQEGKVWRSNSAKRQWKLQTLCYTSLEVYVWHQQNQ